MRRSRCSSSFRIRRSSQDALANLVARVVRCYWGGDHSLFLGQVEYVRYGDGTPLLFHGGRYERFVQEPHVFSGLPGGPAQPILATGVERSYNDGATIMRRGEAGDTLYLIVDGAVRVERPGRSIQARRRRADRGDRGAGTRKAAGSPTSPPWAVRCLEVARDDLLQPRGESRAAIALIGVLARASARRRSPADISRCQTPTGEMPAHGHWTRSG